MDLIPLLVLLLSYCAEVGARVKLSPLTLTVLQGNAARFTCTPSTDKWTVMIWLLNDAAVLTISSETGVLPSINPNVTAEKGLKGDSWDLVLKDTKRDNQGEVTCDLQEIDRTTASLFVQEKGNVEVAGDDKLAFKGYSVLFECKAAGWYPKPSLQWQVDGREVSQSEYSAISEESGKSLFTVTSKINVTAAKSSDVECLASVSALSEPLKSRVRLTVVAEVLQEDDDCTIPLVITASLAALLLLLLLCICAVLYYRQRRQAKSNTQEAVRFDQSVFGRSSVAEATGGKINLGYSSGGPTDAEDSRSQMDFVTFYKVPDVVSSSSQSLHNESQKEESSQNVRRITTV
ncbi:immunoglobulin superfamily member 5 isoform X2 [Mugil cephalus]|uniref:immunoglobulin superfamily member 5 isoform X2 n=1 Tax=Mugil cephalus TaxID=48193 RepID=UPI001FB7B5C0|nr:immunoglobulin superfamily member 5 isoform X2 [Mugil cephalus]